ncbi:MAG: hypothetical protein HY657_17145 [Acidobacteria bacterium]|nr:hypothetical protein [Acidobacteriota bacterium]
MRTRRRYPQRQAAGRLADLNPYVVDVLLEGWGGPTREYPGHDLFAVFDLNEADIAALQRAHHVALSAEWQRRGGAGPYFAEARCAAPDTIESRITNSDTWAAGPHAQKEDVLT